MSEQTATPLDPTQLQRIDAYWRACNYLAVGMIYLRDNPLLKEPLKEDHLKKRLLGHWGASPGLAFMYCHTNRIILEHEQQAIFLAGPGHGAPGVLGPVYLEGTYSALKHNRRPSGLARRVRRPPGRVEALRRGVAELLRPVSVRRAVSGRRWARRGPAPQ